MSNATPFAYTSAIVESYLRHAAACEQETPADELFTIACGLVEHLITVMGASTTMLAIAENLEHDGVAFDAPFRPSIIGGGF